MKNAADCTHCQHIKTRKLIEGDIFVPGFFYGVELERLPLQQRSGNLKLVSLETQDSFFVVGHMGAADGCLSISGECFCVICRGIHQNGFKRIVYDFRSFVTRVNNRTF